MNKENSRKKNKINVRGKNNTIGGTNKKEVLLDLRTKIQRAK